MFHDKGPLWEDANMVNPTTFPDLPELYHWEEKMLVRMHCHQIIFNCLFGQDSGEINIQLAKEGRQLWKIPIQFDNLNARLIKPSSCQGLPFSYYGSPKMSLVV
jgi:hypothetical protein